MIPRGAHLTASVLIENGYEKEDLSKTITEIRRKLSNENIEQTEEEVETKPIVTLPWIPGVSTMLRRVYKKAGS